MKPKTRAIIGGFLIFIGILLVGESTGLYSPEDLMQTLMPILFIIGGIWLISRRKKQQSDQYPPGQAGFPPPHSSQPDEGDIGEVGSFSTGSERAKPFTEESPGDQSSSGSSEQAKTTQSPEFEGSGKLRYRKTFGDMFIDLNGVSLQNIEISAGVGDVEIVLTGGTLEEGLNRIIISSFIGDIRIFASPDLPTFIHSSSFVGDIDVMRRRASGFGNSIDSQTANYDSSAMKLYIACNNFIGDIKVYGL